MAVKNGNLLFFEFVPSPVSRTVNGLKFSIGYQLSFLLVGDALLRKVPIKVREKLKAPISADVLMLVVGQNKNGIAPERARAAILVAEGLNAIWEKIKPHVLESKRRKRRKYSIAIDKDSGRIWYKKEVVSYTAVIVAMISKEMAKSARIKYPVILEMWKAFLEIVREGNTPIPGLRRKVSK